MCTFLKGSVKLKRVSSGLGRSGRAVSGRLPCLLGPVPTPAVAGLAVSRSVSVVVAAGSRDRSWQRRSLPTHSFASYRPRHAGAAPPGLPGGRGFIWCEFRHFSLIPTAVQGGEHAVRRAGRPVDAGFSLSFPLAAPTDAPGPREKWADYPCLGRRATNWTAHL